MDFSSVTTLIGSYGFPIVACIVMAWYVKYSTDKNQEQISEIETKHATEMSEIKTSLDNNTLAIQRLCDFLSLVHGGESNADD